MALLRSVQSSSKILDKLSILANENKFYEAHQLYRTIYFRYSNSKRYRELASVLYDGAISFLHKEQFITGSDLAMLYIETLNNDQDLNNELDKSESLCIDIAYKLGDLLSLIPPQSTERMNFIISSIKLKPGVFPAWLIHKRYAQILLTERNFPQSRYHLLHCNHTCADECAQMLIEYNITCGYPSEVDVFITQFILQLLCVQLTAVPADWKVETPSSYSGLSSLVNNLNDEEAKSLSLNNCLHKSIQHAYANLTLQSYVAKHPQIQKNSPPFTLPLINFIWFLILAIGSGKSSVFNLLRKLYDSSLKRDPSYNNYLNRIGELYFDIRLPRNNQRNFFSNFVQSLLEDDEGNDSGEDERPTRNSVTNVKTATPRANDELD